MNELQLMTIEEAAAFLNLKVSKLRRDVFMKDELLKWLDQKIVPLPNQNRPK